MLVRIFLIAHVPAMQMLLPLGALTVVPMVVFLFMAPALMYPLLFLASKVLALTTLEKSPPTPPWGGRSTLLRLVLLLLIWLVQFAALKLRASPLRLAYLQFC